MKTNFRKEKDDDFDVSKSKTIINKIEVPDKQLTPKEFEDWVRKSGARGSFMIYRTKNNTDDELGLDEL